MIFKKKKREKLIEIFDRKEKNKFIQTLLIISGLIVLFNKQQINLIPLFTLFIVGSLMYILWLAILEKSEKKNKEQHKFFSISYHIFLSAFIAFSFSAIVALIGIQGINLEGLVGLAGIILIFALYAILGIVICIALYKDNKIENL